MVCLFLDDARAIPIFVESSPLRESLRPPSADIPTLGAMSPPSKQTCSFPTSVQVVKKNSALQPDVFKPCLGRAVSGTTIEGVFRRTPGSFEVPHSKADRARTKSRLIFIPLLSFLDQIRYGIRHTCVSMKDAKQCLVPIFGNTSVPSRS